MSSNKKGIRIEDDHMANIKADLFTTIHQQGHNSSDSADKVNEVCKKLFGHDGIEGAPQPDKGGTHGTH